MPVAGGQTLSGAPPITDGCAGAVARIATVMLSFAEHTTAPVDVNVNTALPPETSLAPGV